MFTGIIEEVGSVASIGRGAHSAVLWINAHEVLQGTKIGDSIATNGVCLTVTTLRNGAFAADVMPQTLDQSALGELEVGSPVNLERALRVGDRVGGHFVSGHIDGVGTIAQITRNDNAVLLRIEAEESILRYIVPRGSIAVEGISLTVAEMDESTFTVSLIPHTFSHTDLSVKRVGSRLNLECDMIGKYAERAALAFAQERSEDADASTLSLESLIEAGF